MNYFDHVEKGFWTAIDIFGIMVCGLAAICMLVFGWPLYLISRLTK